MPKELKQRNAERYPFVANCDAIELKSGVKISGRTSDISSSGCYIDTISPFPVGTVLRLGVKRDAQTLTVEARVVFSQVGMGMGVSFVAAAPDQQALLDRWIGSLSGEPVAEPAATSELHEAAQPGIGVSFAPAMPGLREPIEAEIRALCVLDELILLLFQKGILTEAEGKSLAIQGERFYSIR